jgi:outer membrane receptor for ferrienterochelin and colicins
LRLLQPDLTFQTVTDVHDLERLEPTITNAFELGYRGLIGKFRLGADVYHTRVENFVGHLRVITPNVFLEPSTLADYLEQQGVAGADSVARYLSEVPLGTITPVEARDPADLIVAVRNFGEVTYWGSDLSASFDVSRKLTVGGTFSWVSRDLFQMVDDLEDLALNAPARKGSFGAVYREDAAGWWASCLARSVSSFPVRSGMYVGTVESYTLIDLRFGVRLAASPMTSLTVTAENILDERHQEFVGSPALGRFLLARLGVGF